MTVPPDPKDPPVVAGRLITAPGAQSPAPLDLPAAPTPTSDAASERRESSNPVYRFPQAFGRYTLLKRIAVGGMAEAFLAQATGPSGFQKMMVVKRMLPHLAEDARFVLMFQREAKVAAMLTHTNVVQIYELGEIDGANFIAMEYVDGAPLHKLARTAWVQGKTIPMEVICCAIADAALGLAAAHDLRDEQGNELGVVHRDISPDNLMMNREGVTKVLDFGVAKVAGTERTATGEVKGKLPFLAPEHILGEKLDGRADLYALGVTFYWLVTGRRPFQATSDLKLMEMICRQPAQPPHELNPHVPLFISDVIMRLLEKDRALRHANGMDLHDELSDALPARRSVVVPFVTAVVTKGLVHDADRQYPADVVASTPQTESIRSAWSKRRSVLGLPAASTDVIEQLSAAASATNANANANANANTNSASDAAADAQPESRALAAITPTTATAAATTLPTLTTASRNTRQRAAAAGLALCALAAVVIVIAVNDDEPSVPTTAPVPVSPSEPAAPLAAPTTASAPVAVPAPASAPAVPPTASPAPAPAPAPAPTARAPIAVQTQAPSGVEWLSDRGKVLGAGATTLKVPAGTRQLMAVDKKRGGRAVVPIVAGVANYGALPRGKIHPRANPYADVYLGSERLGTTPFPPVDVVSGKYTLRFVNGDREQKRTVEVKGAEVVRVVVDFNEK